MKEFFQKIKDQLKNIIIGVLITALIIGAIVWAVKMHKINKELENIRVENKLLEGKWTQAEIIMISQKSVISAKDTTIKKLLDQIKSGDYVAGQLYLKVDSLSKAYEIATSENNKSFVIDDAYLKFTFQDNPPPKKDSIFYFLKQYSIKEWLFKYNNKFSVKAVDMRNGKDIQIDSLIVEMKEGGHKWGFGGTTTLTKDSWDTGPTIALATEKREYSLSPVVGMHNKETRIGGTVSVLFYK